MKLPIWVQAVLGCVLVVSVSMLFGWFASGWPAVRFVSNAPEAAAAVLGTLAIVALLIERSLSVVNNILFAEEELKLQASISAKASELAALRHESRIVAEQDRAFERHAVAAGARPIEIAPRREAARMAENMRSARTFDLLSEIDAEEQAQASIDASKERNRLTLAFGFSFVVALVGVRALTPLILPASAPATCPGEGCDFTGLQGRLVAVVDILLTAGLLAGGSNGLAKVIESIRPKQASPPPP